MADFPRLEPGWRRLNDDFAWAAIYPPDPPDDGRALPYEPHVFAFCAIILVAYNSATDIGRAAHNHLIPVLRGTSPALENIEFDQDQVLPLELDDFRFTLLRTNAQVSANPKHMLIVLGINCVDDSIAGFDFKHRDRRCSPRREDFLAEGA
jgi:hypothetical protein